MEQTAALPVIISVTIKSLMLAVETTNTQTMRIKRDLEAKSTDHVIEHSLGETKIFPHCVNTLRVTSENLNLIFLKRTS